jgi:hypothetical protein
MANKVLPAPPEVLEPGGSQGLTCWAAALASFMSVNPKAPAKYKGKSQTDLIDDMAWPEKFVEFFGLKKLILENGALTKEGVKFMLLDSGMMIKVFPQVEKLTPSFLYSQMLKYGYLYLVLAYPGGVAHAVVVYGVINAFGNGWSLSVMDPWPDNGGLVQYSKADFSEFKQAMVGWLE